MFLLLPVGRLGAQTETLSDGNSSVTLNLTGPGAGMDSWMVDGQNQLNLQWFYFRAGSTATAASVGSLPLLSAPVQPTAASLNTTYLSAGQFSLQVVYSLVGGAPGSGTADLTEQIKIQNLTSAPLAFNFFQYANFQLGGPALANSQTVQLETNRKGLYNEALVGAEGIALTENVDSAISPGASNGEAGLGPNTLNHIRGTAGYNLDNHRNSGPGDATWALQWTNSIAANGTLIISKDLNIAGVPEPAAWALLSLGLTACALGRRLWGRRQ
ncbi:MAG TPA: PEP-CTERM sorting domain-containing protein [Verrucomicrobiae bacterium]|nr:PEP-CTERM sorting domain-containing protein [Verrucomicrobiae bacterium]